MLLFVLETTLVLLWLTSREMAFSVSYFHSVVPVLRRVCLFFFASMFCFAADEPMELQKIWALPLRQLVPMPPKGWDSWGVWGIAFSPDGQYLAVGFGEPNHDLMRRLVIVSTADPGRTVLQLDLPLNIFWLVSPLVRLSWAPDGRHFAISSGRDAIVVIDLDRGSTCRVEGSGAAFISDSEMIAWRFTPGHGHALAVFTSQCSIIREWQLYEGIQITDVSVFKSLLAVWGRLPNNPKDRAVGLMNIGDRQILTTFGPKLDSLGSVHFARGGASVCGQARRLPGSPASIGIHCWDLTTQSETEVPIEVGYATPNKSSANRMILLEYQRRTMPQKLANFLDRSAETLEFKRHVIWDFEKGRAIAAYTPPISYVKWAGTAGKHLRLYGHDISPDGQYIAQGSPDSVILYKIP